MKILIYYDGTGYVREALATVKKYVKAFRAKVDVVCSMSRGEDWQRRKMTDMQDELLDLKTALEKENIPCETHLLSEGHYAGHDVVQFAEEHGADQIIIGADKNTRVEKLILGSVTQYVLLNADCPVIII